jgi:hypothetical protein
MISFFLLSPIYSCSKYVAFEQREVNPIVSGGNTNGPRVSLVMQSRLEKRME